MEKIRSTEQRTIDTVEVLVETVYSLEYNGNWEFSCYRAKINDRSYDFIGYPSDKEIRERLLT